MSDLVSVQVKVHGFVQGVFFRDFTSRRARELGVTGYVRNLPGGRTVAVQAEGDMKKLGALIGYLKIGPPGARIDNMDVSWSEYTGSYSRFGIRY